MRTPAIVFVREGTVELGEIEMPPPGKGQVQVRTRYSAVSTGIETWCCMNRYTRAAMPFPCVPGHQRVGAVTAVGEGVTGWAEGETAVATVGAWDGPAGPFWGAHAAVANSPAKELYKVPPGCDVVDAAAATAAQVGHCAGHRPALQPGDWVLVYGDGIIGQFAAQAVRGRGAKVIMAGHYPRRMELAAGAGVDVCVENTRKSVAAAVRQKTGGKPVVAVIDTVQTIPAQREYVPLLANGTGQVVFSGFTPGICWSDVALLQRQQLTCHYVSGWTRAGMEAALASLADGGLRFGPLVTHRVPYTAAPAVWRMILDKTEPFLGILFDWRKAPV